MRELKGRRTNKKMCAKESDGNNSLVCGELGQNRASFFVRVKMNAKG
jgi:hypothetical protein